MVDQASRLIEEIQQIKAQYVAEVGKGRRVWPRSIKERAARLDEMGVPAKALAKQTGISYETLILWRYNRRHAQPGGFHEVKVEARPALPVPTAAMSKVNSISKSTTVTATNFEMPPGHSAMQGAVRVTTPNGFVVEGLDSAAVALLIDTLSRSGGPHAS
jgi:transposase-like protein